MKKPFLIILFLFLISTLSYADEYTLTADPQIKIINMYFDKINESINENNGEQIKIIAQMLESKKPILKNTLKNEILSENDKLLIKSLILQIETYQNYQIESSTEKFSEIKEPITGEFTVDYPDFVGKIAEKQQ